MDSEIQFLKNEEYKFINNLINEKMYILKKCEDFNKQYLKLFDVMQKLETTLGQNQKKLFDEITELSYNVEQYYFTLAYSLGVKYGRYLEML